MTIRAILRALRLIATPRAAEHDIDDEIEAHISLQAARHVALGMDADAARLKAENEFGPAAATKQAVLGVHANPGAAWPEVFAGDIRFACRSLARHRVFSGVTITVLTLGIAAATLMFSVVSGVILRPLPYQHPDQLVMIWADFNDPSVAGIPEPVNGLQIVGIQQHGRVFQSVSGVESRQMNLQTDNAPERIDGAGVDDNFFQTMGVTPAIGRGFQAGEENPGADHEVVIGWDLWQRRFAGDRGVIGRKILLNNEPYTVIGVAPQRFNFPAGAGMPSTVPVPVATELWVPVKPALYGPSEDLAVARVKRGTTLAATLADLDDVAHALDLQIPGAKGFFAMHAIPLRTQLVGDVQGMLFILLGAVGVLLIIACTNAAQLFLARLQGRRGELAIRAALGGSAARIARVLLLEALALTGIAGVAGAVLGSIAVGLVRHAGSNRMPRVSDIAFDGRVIAAAVAITVIAGLLFGVVPAFRAGRMRLAEALRRRGRSGDFGSPRTRRILIVSEIALSVMLVTGSGLLIRSLGHQLGGDLGFTAPHGLTFELSLPALAYPEKQGATFMEHPKSVDFFHQALERIRAIPGVKAAAIGKPLPMSGSEEGTVFTPENSDPRLTANGHAPIIDYTVASPQMFTALGTPLLNGRDFDETDQHDSPPVVILNAAAAHWLWPGQSAVGHRLRLGGARSQATWMTVIGVVADMRRYSLIKDPSPEIIVPYTQRPYPTFAPMQFVVRSTVGSAALAAPIQRAISSIDPTIPVAQMRTIDQLVADVSANARFATITMSIFGIAALLLAMVGLYGVIAYTVNQRRQEFGLRTALGAGRGDIIRLVLRDGLTLTVIGLSIGAVLAVAGGRVLRSMLYHVSVVDPVTAIATIGVLAGATILACVIPALRAAGVDPRIALEEG
ncbi:MAG TPA: ABC transporter permease [Gemmatimonadales bacterium]|jgi:predicted permease